MLYYAPDLLIGFGAPVALFALVRTGVLSPALWRFFWMGTLIGIVWEAPIFVLSAESASLPIIRWLTPFPMHYVVFMLAHAFWDGGLLLVGVGLCRLVCPPGWERRFEPRAMAVMLGWGQVQELAVELSSIASGGWVYVSAYGWNPTLFHFRGEPITLLPQLIWVVAPVLFYVGMLWQAPRPPASTLGSVPYALS